MDNPTTHEGQLEYLKKIEGQVRGIERMIDQKRYCVDIITQIHSIIGALYRVENEVFRKHIQGCVATTLKKSSESEKARKIQEIVELAARFRKAA